MASEKLPWMKLWTRDILADEALRSCSLAARGLCFYYLCMMHRSGRKGYLLKENGQPWTLDQLARMTGCSTDEAAHLTQELITSGVFCVTNDDTHTIYSKRMLKDDDTSGKRSVAGSRGARAKHAKEKHLPQQNSGKQGGKENGNPLEYDSSSFDEGAKKEDDFFPGVGVQGERILPQQNSGKTADPADEALNAAALRCTVAWLDVLVTRRDDPAMCAKTFRAMLDEGIPEAAILAEIALGPKTVPKRKRSEWLNQFYDRLAGSLGFTSRHVPGTTRRSLASGPAAAEVPASPVAEPASESELPGWDEFKHGFITFVPGCPKDIGFLDRVKALFGPPGIFSYARSSWAEASGKSPASGINATPDEMMFALNCYLDDSRRANPRWDGNFARNAYRYLSNYIASHRKNRVQQEQAAERQAAAERDRPQAEQPQAEQPQAAPVAAAFAVDPECIKVADAIRERIGEPRFNLWFQGKVRLTRGADGFQILVPNRFLQNWLTNKFGAELSASFESATGSRAFKIEIDQERQSSSAGDGERQEMVG
jgi:hypothetical protein